MADYVPTHDEMCLCRDCLVVGARRRREQRLAADAAVAETPQSATRKSRYRNDSERPKRGPRVSSGKRTAQLKTVQNITMTLDITAVTSLEAMCRADNSNRSRFVTRLIHAEWLRRYGDAAMVTEDTKDDPRRMDRRAPAPLPRAADLAARLDVGIGGGEDGEDGGVG